MPRNIPYFRVDKLKHDVSTWVLSQMLELWIDVKSNEWQHIQSFVWLKSVIVINKSQSLYFRCAVPEAGIKCMDKQLRPTDTVECNHLSIPLMPASGTTLLISLTCHIYISPFCHFCVNMWRVIADIGNNPDMLWVGAAYLGNAFRWLKDQSLVNTDPSLWFGTISTGIEYCVAINLQDNGYVGKFRAHHCANHKGFVCETP